MASSNVLKEFLVKIGFKIDEQQFRNFQESMRATGKNAVELAKTTATATTILGASLKAMSTQMEKLYFASQRTGASATHLKEFSFAASQVGVSAEQAQASIEALAAARRTQPGLNGILGGMGIDPKQTDNAAVMVQLLAKLHSMPHFQGAQIAGMFGIDEQTFNQLETQLPEMQKYLAMREKMFKEAGIDPGIMVAKAHEFMVQLRTLEAGIGNLADIVAYRLMPAGEKLIGWLERAVGWLTKADKTTGGWSSKLLGVATALTGGSLLKGGLGALGKLFGGGGAAVAGEAAGGVAAEGAAAGGAGLLGAVALPAIIISAVGAALVWMTAHPEAVRKAVGEELKKLPKQLGAIGDATAKVEQKLEGGVGKLLHSATSTFTEAYKGLKSVGVVQGLSAVGGPVGNIASAAMKLGGSLAAMTAQFEGHAKNGFGTYRDIAGHLTAGFGHLVKPGEDFSKLDKGGALALLSKDLQSAMESVTKLVKVHLGKNQTDALADFVFNLGEGKLAKSTLLKKLNAGDFSGAASEFSHWNKVMNNGHLVVNAGLAKRREAEANLFRGGQPVAISQKTDIHIEGGDAHGTGKEVARQQGRVNGDLVRNMQGATR